MSADRLPPSEQQRAIIALLSGALLGLVMALLSWERGRSRDPG